MSLTIENCFMLLPGRRVGRGDVTVDGGRIAAIEASEAELAAPMPVQGDLFPETK